MIQLDPSIFAMADKIRAEQQVVDMAAALGLSPAQIEEIQRIAELERLIRESTARYSHIPPSFGLDSSNAASTTLDADRYRWLRDHGSRSSACVFDTRGFACFGNGLDEIVDEWRGTKREQS